MDKIKVFICDDDKFWHDFLKKLVKNYDDIDIVGSASTTINCTEAAVECSPDIILLDVQMEDSNSGVDLIPKILDKLPNVKIIMFTSYDFDEYIFDSFCNGAVDYIVKTMPTEDIVKAIRSVYNNCASVKTEIANKLAQRAKKIQAEKRSFLYLIDKLIKLTPTEFELLKSLNNGLTYKEIANERIVEVEAVRMMASRILKKMDAKNMEQLITEMSSLDVFALFKEK
ncbi:MAG: response regulator transcription factor [Clostridiales bacterium]|nr:response regulator transcription factor [Clostridiales bacterium]